MSKKSGVLASIVTIVGVAIALVTNQLDASLAPTVILSAIFIFGLTSCLSYFLIERPLLLQLQQLRNVLDDDNQAVPLEQLLELKLGQFSKAGKKINDSASELAINSAEMAHFLEHLSNSIVTSGTDVNRIAIAAEQLSANTKEINSNAGAASELANQAMLASTSSAEKLNENVLVAHQLSSEVIDISNKVKSLSAKTAEIQNITNVIDSIAAQTNLLALNAAIEAARAGEQGRGFAVVADEVRALASKTADATDKIGAMLNQITNDMSQTSTVMANVVEQTHTVVTTMDHLSLSLNDINQLIKDSANASDQISQAFEEHNLTTSEISSSIINIRDFLQDKSGATHDASLQASSLSANAESIFVQLVEFKTGSLLETMYQEAQAAAAKVSQLFEQAISDTAISRGELFNFNYVEVKNSKPPKFNTSFDRFTDKVLPELQDGLLEQFDEMIYAGAVDINGYFPTHNTKFCQPLTGDYNIDFSNNRTKRIFNDPTGSRCGKHTEKFLLQTYKRDTGEIMHDVSAPIFVNGEHWGGFRIGFKAQ